MVDTKPSQAVPIIQEEPKDPIVDQPNRIEWANHLWEEWKYRHEAWRKTFYRSTWIILVFELLPLVKSSLISIDLQQIFKDQPSLSAIYLGVIVLLLIASNWLLAFEYARLLSVERKLSEVRKLHNLTSGYDPHEGEGSALAKAFRRGPYALIATFFYDAAIVFLGLMIYFYIRTR